MVSENVTTLLLATETAKAVVAVNKILNWSLKLVPSCGPIKWSKKLVKEMVQKNWSKKISPNNYSEKKGPNKSSKKLVRKLIQKLPMSVLSSCSSLIIPVHVPSLCSAPH